jgi:adenosylcobinamide-GDP ribazoletransferase
LIRDFLCAVAFLTRLPVGRAFQFDAKQVARSQRWFPLAGALLGAIESGAVWFCGPHLPFLVTALLVLALDAWLTGAMHLDGLADTADGFGGGTTREDVLRIMRDHAIGSYGAVAVVLAIALKAAAIAAAIPARRAIFAVLLAPPLGRWAAVLLSVMQPYARPSSDDHPRSVGSPTRFVQASEAIIATCTAAALTVLVGYWRGGYWRAAAAFVLSAATAALWGRYCRRRIGGITLLVFTVAIP